MPRVFIRAAFAAAFCVVTAAATEAAARCLPWKAAAPIIAANGLLSGKAVYGMVQSRIRGKIIQAILCNDKGNFTYKVIVLGPKGDVNNVTVDARTGRF